MIKCILVLKNIDEKTEGKRIKINNCKLENLENIYEELYSRLIKPLYVTFLITICLLFILKSKDDYTFKFYKLKIYIFCFLFIIFLEISPKFIGVYIVQNLLISTLPFVFTFLMYVYFLKKLKINKL